MSKPHVSVMFLILVSNRLTTLSVGHLATLKAYAVYLRCPQYQVILHQMEELGDLPKWQANTLDVVLGQHSPDTAISHLDIWKKSN